MDRTIEKLLELLTARLELTRGINLFCDGLPVSSPASNDFPAIVVRGVGMQSLIADNKRNQELYNLEVIVMNDSRNYIGSDYSENTPEKEIRKIIEDRDTGFELNENTVMSVIEKEFMYNDDYNIAVTINNITFGQNIVSGFSSEYPMYQGVVSLTVRSKLHNVR